MSCRIFADGPERTSLIIQDTLSINEFMRSLVVIEWFGWKMPQGCRCQPYAGAYSQRAGVGEWTSKLPRHVHGCTSPVCVLLCLHTLVDLARQDSVWL